MGLELTTLVVIGTDCMVVVNPNTQTIFCSFNIYIIFQTFVKGYLITFVRLLLGIDAEENSGHLSSVSLYYTMKSCYF